MMHDESNVLTDDHFVIVREFLKLPKHAGVYIESENSCLFKIKMDVRPRKVTKDSKRQVASTRSKEI